MANRSDDKDKNSSAFVFYHGRLVFKLFFVAFGHILSKNKVAPLK